MKKITSRQLIIIILAIIAIAGIGAAVYYYREYRILKYNPQAASEAEVQSLVAEIGRIMQLPNDETPSVATVLDKEKIKDQPFFKNAENGDKLVAYTKAQKAILYRPSSKKIIEVAPLNIDQTTQVNAALKIAYYNGSDESGRAAEAEQAVKKAYSGYETVEVKDAAKKDYEKTIIVDVSGTHAAEAAALAALVNGSVGEMPDGETKPAADILIISGNE